MNKLFAVIFVGAASVGLNAITSVASAATAEAKASYKAAKDSADAEHKVAREKCDALNGNSKDICIAEADLARTRIKSDAEVSYKNNTARVRASTVIDIASAEYDLARAKCNSKAANEKDVCIKEAKANYVAAKADAKADKKVATARADARDDKRDANYKVAIEKCDGLAGASKDACVSAAKTQYGK